MAGPTHDNFPPFKWSDTSLTPIPEFKPIDEFNFEPIKHKWGNDVKYEWVHDGKNEGR